MNHGGLVVRFYIKVVAFLQLVGDKGSDKSQVCAKTQLKSFSANRKGNRIQGVMLNAKRMDLQIAKFKCLPCRKNLKLRAVVKAFDDSLAVFCISENRNAHVIG